MREDVAVLGVADAERPNVIVAKEEHEIVSRSDSRQELGLFILYKQVSPFISQERLSELLVAASRLSCLAHRVHDQDKVLLGEYILDLAWDN